MKTPNSMEELMRTWKPRQPAARLEESLFGNQSAPVCETRRSHTMMPWWKPLGASAVAFCVAIFTLLNVMQFTIQGGSGHATPLSFSNYHSGVSLALASAPINTLTAPILSWTNEGSSGSIPRSFKISDTNQILH